MHRATALMWWLLTERQFAGERKSWEVARLSRPGVGEALMRGLAEGIKDGLAEGKDHGFGGVLS
jgi:hypothetical protein